MAKKAPFFSHDMNARHDPKMSAMRGIYGAQGYGWFWMLIEMMAEADGYQLDCKSKYSYSAYAMQLHCKTEDLQKFVLDCIHEFELFESDGDYFWSKSLRKRMQYRDFVAEKRAAAANKRWENQHLNANAIQNDANAMQNDANKTKQNETKQLYGETVYLTVEQYEKLIADFGKEETDYWISKLDEWQIDNPKKKKTDHNRTIRNWIKSDARRNSQRKQSNKTITPLPTVTTTKEVEERLESVYKQRGII